MSDAPCVSAADAMLGWRDDVLAGTPPTFYPIGKGPLAQIEIGPKLVTLFGGAPAAGKTAFTMQAVVDALRLNQSLRALVCNVEMSPDVLLDRQLSRLSGVDLKAIRYRQLTVEHAVHIQQAIDTLAAIAERLFFVRPPFTLENVAEAVDSAHADLILLDYIQRISPPGEHGDKRGSINAAMDYLRRFTDADIAVLAVAAVGRTKDKAGRSSYDGSGLNLASFRESSELEFGADDAFILVADPVSGDVTLRHLKARHSEPRDITLGFERSCQRFTSDACIASSAASEKKNLCRSKNPKCRDGKLAASGERAEEDAF